MLYLLVPWTATNLVDFFFVRRGHYAITELFNPNGIYGTWGARGLIAYAARVRVRDPVHGAAGSRRWSYTGPLAPNGIDIAWIVGLARVSGGALLGPVALARRRVRTARRGAQRARTGGGRMTRYSPPDPGDARATPASARSRARRTSHRRRASTPRSSASRSTPRPRCAPAPASAPRGFATRRCCCGPWNAAQASTCSTSRSPTSATSTRRPGNAERTDGADRRAARARRCEPARPRSRSAATTRSCSASCAPTPPSTGRSASSCSTPTPTPGSSTTASATSTARRSSAPWKRA